jgi:hypothetical protein
MRRFLLQHGFLALLQRSSECLSMTCVIFAGDFDHMRMGSKFSSQTTEEEKI